MPATKATTRTPKKAAAKKATAKPSSKKARTTKRTTRKPVVKAAKTKKNTLTDRQKLFVNFYLQSWNATEAAREAGYADPELSGWRNRQNEVISAEISRRIAMVAMSADECLVRLGRMARGTLRPFVMEDDGAWPNLMTEEALANFDLLKKIKPKRREGGPPEDRWTETEVELEIHDPLRALELIGKHHKLFTDRTEHTGADGGPIEIDTTAKKDAELELKKWRDRQMQQLSTRNR